MKRTLLGLAAGVALLLPALAATPSVSAAYTCPSGFHLYSNKPSSPYYYDNPYFWEVFGSKDANGNGAVCARGNGPNLKALVVVDDK